MWAVVMMMMMSEGDDADVECGGTIIATCAGEKEDGGVKWCTGCNPGRTG